MNKADSTGELVQELHEGLFQRYARHSEAIEHFWRTFTPAQRAECMKLISANGDVLKHNLDKSLGEVFKFIPEWNLRDVAGTDANFFLDLLRYRATTSLEEQYMTGVNGGLGDRNVILRSMRDHDLRHVEDFKNCYTFFMADFYGQSFKIAPGNDQWKVGFKPAMDAGLCIPQATGELVLLRQMYTLQSVTYIIEHILDLGSTTRAKSKGKKNAQGGGAPPSQALSKLSVEDDAQKKATLADLVAAARDQQAQQEDNINILCTEPVVLTHAVEFWFLSQPGLVADEKGRRLPCHTDKFISPSLFDAIHHAVQGAALWGYVSRLLQLLLAQEPPPPPSQSAPPVASSSSSNNNKMYRAIILQELSNTCQLLYTRSQSIFKRNVQTGSGLKWFKRLSNVQDRDGEPRVSLKGKPQDLTRSDPQLHYLLRLCQPTAATPTSAVDWLQKLARLHEAHPLEREKMIDREAESLYDMALAVGFNRDLAGVVSMPSVSRKKGQAFLSRSQALEDELNKIKTGVDLREFAVPIDNLLEPGMAEGSLKALDEFIVGKTGTKLGFLYQDLVEECLADLHAQYLEQVQVQAQETSAAASSIISPCQSSIGTGGSQSQPPKDESEIDRRRRRKEKTRPSHSSIYDTTPKPETPPSFTENEETNQQQQQQPKLKVSPSTTKLFATLFDKSLSRGSIPWTAFESAMADLGFSVVPKFGSVYTFSPPPDGFVVSTRGGQARSLTVHRPHTSKIEGYLIPMFARRLRRAYGWDGATFSG